MSKKNKATKQVPANRDITIRMAEGEDQNFQLCFINFSPFDSVRMLDDENKTYFVLGDTLSAFGVKSYRDPIYMAIPWEEMAWANFENASGETFLSLQVITEEAFIKLATKCDDPKAQAFRERAFERLIFKSLE